MPDRRPYVFGEDRMPHGGAGCPRARGAEVDLVTATACPPATSRCGSTGTAPTSTPSTRIFHVALLADWEAAQRVGEYRVSTLGRTVEEEGFLHASFAHQWPGVRAAFYGDVEQPLVLLEVDPDRVDVPVVLEAPPGAGPDAEEFPHVYGPLPVGAVVAVRPLR